MRIIRILLIILPLIGYLDYEVKAQTTNYKFQSILILNFIKNIEWPKEYQSGDFVIGVLGRANVSNDLMLFAKNRTVDDRKIVIKRYSSIWARGIDKCHVLFVTASSKNDMRLIKRQLGNAPILLITEKEGLAKKGSCINFVTVGRSMKFELNESALKQVGLKPSTRLLRLAIVI